MMLLCWFTLLLRLSASAESNAVWRESGEDVTLRCSSVGCSSITERYQGMYLYQDSKERIKVFYYHPEPGSTDKITPIGRFIDRIETSGSLESHTVTISNLTVDDSGFYRCVYVKFPHVEDVCSVNTLFIRGVAPCSRPAEEPHVYPNVDEKSSPLVLTIITSCIISTLVTIIFILLIFPRVKQWASSSSRTTSGLQVTVDNVYEVMTKNSLQPTREQPSPSLNTCA